MPVSLHKFIVQAGSQVTGFADLQHYAMQVGVVPTGYDYLYAYGAQALTTVANDSDIYALGAQVCFRASRTRSNDYADPTTLGIEDTDMIFNDVIFPECISYGSTGVPRYVTDKAEVLSGDETRQTRYRYPRHEYSIAMENLPADEIAQIMNIWHVCSGDFAGFLFLDPMDHTSANSSTNLSATEISASDQVVEETATAGEYHLFKTYTHNGRTKKRRIKYPKLDTLLVAVDGVETTAWSYNTDRGVLTIGSNISVGTSLTVSKAGSTLTTTGSGFLDFEVGDLFFIDGFTNDAINQPSGDPLRVSAKASNNSITVETFDGGIWAVAQNEADAAVTIDGTGLPSGTGITAGFYFYVPVRFDDGDNAMSEIVAGLRETAYANFNDIKLREIFE